MKRLLSHLKRVFLITLEEMQRQSQLLGWHLSSVCLYSNYDSNIIQKLKSNVFTVYFFYYCISLPTVPLVLIFYYFYKLIKAQT
jgi:hypothetical protein